MSGKNSDQEVIVLAQVQFGGQSHLFDDVTLPRHLADALVQFARNRPERAIEVREFMDLHELNYTIPRQRLSEILHQNARLTARSAWNGCEDVDDWCRDKEGLYSVPRRRGPRRSVWQRIADMFR